MHAPPVFAHAHADDADWRAALDHALAQLDPAALAQATLGWCYFTDHHAPAAPALLAALRERLPGVAWTGTAGLGICAGAVEYFDTPGLAIMLAALPRTSFRLFSGRRPLAAGSAGAGFAAHTALVHADPATPELTDLIGELSARVGSGYLFGGLASGRGRNLMLACDVDEAPADGVLEGGLSGVAFDADVALVSRVTQGCQPVGASRRITESQRNVVYALDGEPALDCLLRDLGIEGIDVQQALPQLRGTLVGLSEAAVASAPRAASRAASDFTTPPRAGAFGTETRVRHLIGLDPLRRGVAIADMAPAGLQLAFCRRNVEAARRDLTRAAAEVRSALEPEELPLAHGARVGGGRRIAGALYISCTGRGGPHFGAPSAELQLLQHVLSGGANDVPLVGFFAAGEIGHGQVYGYTGVLTAFTTPA